MDLSAGSMALIVLLMPVSFALTGYAAVRQKFDHLVGWDQWHQRIKGPRRPRALTAPLPYTDPKTHKTKDLLQTTSDQTQCRFLSRLNEDIRILIYSELMTGHTFHLSSSTTSGPPSKYHCERPWQLIDEVHGSCCHGPQTPKHLLALPLTCRQIYTETISLLYRRNTLTFSQEFCFVNFLRALPPQRYKDLRCIEYYVPISEKLVKADPAAMADWREFCQFWGDTFGSHLQLYLHTSPAGSATYIRKAETPDLKEWLVPLWELGKKLHLNLGIPSGDSGACYPGKLPPIEPMSLVIDFEQIRKAYNGIPLEDTLAVIHEKIQLALWNWHPYGKLMGEP